MSQKQTWTREELRQALMDYDAYHGNWPESYYEGLSVWEWLNEGPDPSARLSQAVADDVADYWKRDAPS